MKKKKSLKTLVLILTVSFKKAAKLTVLKKPQPAKHAIQHLVTRLSRTSNQLDLARNSNQTMLLQKISKPHLAFSYRASTSLSPQAKMATHLIKKRRKVSEN